jgi:hypothetical protein
MMENLLFDPSKPDLSLLEMTNLLEGLIDFEELVAPFDDETFVRTRIESAEMSLPLELDLVANSDGTGVEFRVAPPIYRLETTFAPVFHQLKIRIESIENLTKIASF